MRETIRTNLTMQAPNASEVYFRFYPRVLRDFLPRLHAAGMHRILRSRLAFRHGGRRPRLRRTMGKAAYRLIPISREIF